MPKKIRHYFGACFIIICLFLIKIIVFLLLYHLKFKFTGIKNIQFVIPRNEESHQVIQIMRFLAPRNDNILNKYSSIFKAKLV